MRVEEVRAELLRRGLDPHGDRDVLELRLKAAMDLELDAMRPGSNTLQQRLGGAPGPFNVGATLQQRLGVGGVTLQQRLGGEGACLQQPLGVTLQQRLGGASLQQPFGGGGVNLQQRLGGEGASLQQPLGVGGVNLQQRLGGGGMPLQQPLGVGGVTLQQRLGFGVAPVAFHNQGVGSATPFFSPRMGSVVMPSRLPASPWWPQTPVRPRMMMGALHAPHVLPSPVMVFPEQNNLQREEAMDMDCYDTPRPSPSYNDISSPTGYSHMSSPTGYNHMSSPTGTLVEVDIDRLEHRAERFSDVPTLKRRAAKFEEEVADELVNVREAKRRNLRFLRFKDAEDQEDEESED